MRSQRRGTHGLAGRARALLCGLACAAGVGLVAPQAAPAIINDPDNTLPAEGPCLLSVYTFTLEGNLVVTGIPLAGTQIRIDATSAKLVGRKNTAARICDPLLFQIPSLRWSLVSAPAGQTATIADPQSLSPSVVVGRPGAYRLRLTACPSTCRLTQGGKTKTVGTMTRDVTVNVVAQFAPPPETEPLLPPLFAPGTGSNPPGWSGPTTAPPRFTDAQRDAKCNGGGGVKDPQWVTVEPFSGPAKYRTVEGAVESSRVAAADDFLNHDSQDHNWDVKPDPPYVGLPHPAAAGDMEMEWETNAYPREFRPTAGDRVSAVGYWIFDCGHDGFRAEIHPPVGTAVERPRAVSIPSSFRPPGFPNGLGTNLQVPGIVTDIFFNRRSGETTNNCSRTGLHSPSLTPAAAFPANLPFCVREPHALNRRFTFNVYLPRDPRERAQGVGLTPPPVPVFSGVEKLGRGTGGPEPTVVVRQGGGATWLEVSVDLTSLPAGTSEYARRVTAAWAYPNPQNWGARRWRVRLNSIDVIDDAEPFGDDGDWRFFFNTNNRDREWTKVLDCDGCVDDGETKALNVETGNAAGASGGLGPDLVLFPGQPILVHTTGFDEEVDADDVGTVFNRISQTSGVGNYKGFSNGGDGVYRLNYGIGGGASIGPATLTPEATALLNAYTVGGTPPCTNLAVLARVGLAGQAVRPACVISPTRRDPNLVQRLDTAATVLTRPVLTEERLPVFETEREEFTIQGIAATDLKTLFDGLRRSDPTRLNALLAEINQELRSVPAGLRRDYAELTTTLDRSLPKALADRAFPPGFRRQVKPFPTRRAVSARG